MSERMNVNKVVNVVVPLLCRLSGAGCPLRIYSPGEGA